MIRCLVVDDSRTFRTILRGILEAKPGVAVVGEAADGEEALSLAARLRPDAITMDVRMPRQDGLAAVRNIMRTVPTPVVVVSAAGDEADVSFDALRAGAVEVLPKPRGDDPRRFERDAEAIRQAVRAVAGLTLATRHRRQSGAHDRSGRGRSEPGGSGAEPPTSKSGRGRSELGVSGAKPPISKTAEIVGVASSTGGPAALERILSALPNDFPLPIVLVQHLHPRFEASFVRWLAASTGFAVRLARHGERVTPGTVHVAPADRHLVLAGSRLALHDGPPVRCLKPSGSLLLESLARERGPAAAGLVLTGMGDDGAAGAQALLDAGGAVYAQGPASSVVYGMPRASIERGATPLELDEIPGMLLGLAGAAPARPRLR